MRTLAHIIAHVRAQSRPGSHGAVLLREITRLTAAIQTHHDTKHGTPPGSAAVLAPPDRALYVAAGIAHAVLGWSEGLDERRRAQAPVRETSDV